MLCQPAVDVSAHNQRSVENGLKYSYQTTGGKWMKDGVTDGNKINEIKKKKKYGALQTSVFCGTSHNFVQLIDQSL